MTRPFFSKERISDFESFDRHAHATVALISKRLQEGFAVDVQDAFARFTMDVATESLFGICVDSLSVDPPYPSKSALNKASVKSHSRAEEFARAFATAQEVSAIRGQMGPLSPLFEIFEDKTKQPMKVVNEFMEPIVAEALKRKAALGKGTVSTDTDEIGEGETLLDHFVKKTDGESLLVLVYTQAIGRFKINRNSIDQTVLKDEILNMLVAGRDTVSKNQIQYLLGI